MPAYAIGDPQAPLDRLLTILAAHDLLDDPTESPASLRPDTHLLVVGDYFDRRAGSDAAALRWLIGHPDHQVTLLLGNHDVVRVIEFWRLSDADWADARARAFDLQTPGQPPLPDTRAAFFERHPDIPDPAQCVRDFQEFTVDQRRLVQRLLLDRRLRLATAATLEGGTRALVTHSGLTSRELAVVKAGTDPDDIADALNAFLDDRVDLVRDAWTRGEPARLDLHPLTLLGRPHREAGAFMHHRPAHPDHHPASEFDSENRRKFDPAMLPLGLVQVAGHTPSLKALKTLDGYDVDPALSRKPIPALRVLETDGTTCWYRATPSGQPGRGVLHLIDGGMSDLDDDGYRLDPADYQLLPLEALS